MAAFILLSSLGALLYAGWTLAATDTGLQAWQLVLLLFAGALHALRAAFPSRNRLLFPDLPLVLVTWVPCLWSVPFGILPAVPLRHLFLQLDARFHPATRPAIHRNRSDDLSPGAGHRIPESLAIGLALFLPLLPLPVSAWPETFLLGGLQLLIVLAVEEGTASRQRLRMETDRLRAELHTRNAKIARDASMKDSVEENARIEERSRLAQSLHDRIGHVISASLMQLEAARALLDTQPDRTRSMLDTVLGTLRNGHAAIRETLHSLKPAQEELGLNRVRLAAQAFSSRSGIPVALSLQGDLARIRPSQWKIILDCLEEAMTNILRHAMPAEGSSLSATIDVSALNRLLRVSVRDNGRGAPIIRKGLGLRGMEERLSTVDGQLIVDGTQGFSLIMLMPLLPD